MNFGLFVSSVAGHVVPRWGTQMGSMRAEFIGVTRDREDPTKLVWNEQAIVAIPTTEYVQFRREYDGAIRDGGLTKRSAEEFVAQEQQEERAAAPTIEHGAPVALPEPLALPEPDVSTDAPVTDSGARGAEFPVPSAPDPGASTSKKGRSR